jgi:hypothetical protein
MNVAVNTAATRRTPFSFSWCVVVAFLHLVATFIIVGIYLSVGMGTSTRGARGVHLAFDLWNGFLWIWTPLASAARSPDHTPNEEVLAGLAILWSCIVGLAAGFALPSCRRRQLSN